MPLDREESDSSYESNSDVRSNRTIFQSSSKSDDSEDGVELEEMNIEHGQDVDDQFNSMSADQNGSKIWSWLKAVWNGPKVASDEADHFENSPILYNINRVPILIGERCGPVQKKVILLVYFLVLSVATRLLYHQILFTVPQVDNVELLNLPCGRTTEFWLGNDDQCGLKGEKCMEPFNEHKEVLVRCPAFCNGDGLAYSVIRFGNEKVHYEPYIVKSVVQPDGKPVYRADTFPCIAAYEEGLIGGLFGGSFRMKLADAFPYDYAVDEDHESGHYFNAKFPASFTFEKIDYRAVETSQNVLDLTLVAIVAGVLASVSIALLSSSHMVFYFTSYGAIVTTVVLACDTPIVVKFDENKLGGDNSAWSLLSIYFERLVPLTLAVGLLWLVMGKYTFHGTGFVHRALFLLGCWVTGLLNLTFEKLPIDRLIWSDIRQQKGGLVSFFFIVSIILGCTVVQIRQIWRAGWLRRAFGIYLTLLVALVWVSTGCGGLLEQAAGDGGSGLVFRMHHWVLGLLLIYGCKTRWVGSYLMHGLCLGLLVNGVGKWGFASVFELERGVSRDPNAVPRSIPPPLGVFYDKHNGAIRVLLESAGGPEEGVHGSPDGGLHNYHIDRYRFLINDVLMYDGINGTLSSLEYGEDYHANDSLYLRVSVCGINDQNQADCSNWSEPSLVIL